MGYSINLYLDKSSSRKRVFDTNPRGVLKKELQIFLYLRYSGKTIKIYLERKCTQQQWDSQKQRVNPTYYKSGAIELNKYFDNIYYGTGKIFEENNNNAIETTKDHLREMVDKLNNREGIVRSSITFENAFEEFIKNSSISKQESTIKQYRNTQNHLKNFSQSRRIGLSFEKIDL